MPGSTAKQDHESLKAPFGPYLRNRKDLAAARERVIALQTKIDESVEAERSAPAGARSKDEIRHRREDLAAAVALRTITQGEAEKRRAELNALDESFDKGLAASEAARQARAGLERLRGEANSVIQSLVDEGGALLEQALRAQAESIAGEYIAAARPTRDAFVRLAAIDRLLSAVAGHSAGLVPANGEAAFHLPGSTQLRAFDGLYNVRSYHGLFNKDLRIDVVEAVASERERLRAIGVEF